MSVFGGGVTTARTVKDRLSKSVAWVAAIAVTIFASVWLALHYGGGDNATIKVRDLLVGSIQAESFLATASQNVTANVVIDDVAKFWRIPIGKTNMVYAAVGQARAGIDIKEIEVLDVDTGMGRAKIKLPEVIVSINLNVERSATLANYRNWFGPKAGAEVYEQAQRQAQAAMRGNACSSGIVKTAAQNAEVQIETILAKVGLEQVAFVVEQSSAASCPLI